MQNQRLFTMQKLKQPAYVQYVVENYTMRADVELVITVFIIPVLCEVIMKIIYDKDKVVDIEEYPNDGEFNNKQEDINRLNRIYT